MMFYLMGAYSLLVFIFCFLGIKETYHKKEIKNKKVNLSVIKPTTDSFFTRYFLSRLLISCLGMAVKFRKNRGNRSWSAGYLWTGKHVFCFVRCRWRWTRMWPVFCGRCAGRFAALLGAGGGARRAFCPLRCLLWNHPSDLPELPSRSSTAVSDPETHCLLLHSVPYHIRPAVSSQTDAHELPWLPGSW